MLYSHDGDTYMDGLCMITDSLVEETQESQDEDTGDYLLAAARLKEGNETVAYELVRMRLLAEGILEGEKHGQSAESQPQEGSESQQQERNQTVACESVRRNSCF